MSLQFDEYEIVKYRSGFKRQVLELQAYLWGPDLGINAAYLEWKYSDNPYVNNTIIHIALHAGRVVGMRGAFGNCWQSGVPSQTMICLTDSDGVVHPEHRRHGLFGRLTMAVVEELSSHDYEYLIALSANPITAHSLLKLGWRSTVPLQTAYWQAEQGRDSSLRGFARKLPFLSSVYRQWRRYRNRFFSQTPGNRFPFASLDQNVSQAGPDDSTCISVEKAPQPKAMADLVERIGSDGRIRHVRDQRFFAWRYKNPLSLYRFFFYKDAKLEGFLVLQTSAFAVDSNWVDIVDWEATNTQVLADLLQAAIQRGNFHRLVIRWATLTDEEKIQLKDQGFVFPEEIDGPASDTYRPSVLVRPVHQEKLSGDWTFGNRRMLDVADWDVRPIYSDNF